MPSFEQIISLPALLQAWKAFSIGKKNKSDVAEYAINLVTNLHTLNAELLQGTYRHGKYFYFRVNDTKPRDIHEASVRDRVVHHAMYQALYPYFDKRFIHDSYSCRIEKGTHRALDRFAEIARIAGHNHTKSVWVLKCDIRKCFASIDHDVLKQLLSRHVHEARMSNLCEEVINSFSSTNDGVGIPLGNLTSQLFINIYLNELDQFVKHELRERHYIRYADDFVIMSDSRRQLEVLVDSIRDFLQKNLHLAIHEDKQFIRTVASGVDFLGWVHFSNHRVLRTSTKRRMLRRIEETEHNENTITSYLGLLTHGNAHALRKSISDE